VDCLSSLSSPPASPEGEADGGQAESDEEKTNPDNPACLVKFEDHFTGVNPV
jgi:hypothetical protein